jgi:alpha/beta superfamily hydrolase
MDHSVVRAVRDVAVALGLATLRFDFGGVRGSEGDVSDLAAHRDDLRAAAARAREEAPEGTALGAGYSYGARAWAAVAGRREEPRVDGLLLLAPPTRIPTTPRDFGNLLLRRPLRETTEDLAVVDALLAAAVPTRILVGSDDVVAPAAAYAPLRPPVEVRVLPGLDHFFSRVQGEAGPAEGFSSAVESALRDLLRAAAA